MKRFLVSAVSLLIVGSVFAAGTVTDTREGNVPPQKIKLSWTADTNGVVSGDSQKIYSEQLMRVVFYNGTPAPTNATYAVTLKDANGVDVLAGQGSAVASNASSAASQIVPGVLAVHSTGVTNLYPVTVSGPLTLAISGVGTSAASAGKQGVVVIYAQ